MPDQNTNAWLPVLYTIIGGFLSWAAGIALRWSSRPNLVADVKDDNGFVSLNPVSDNTGKKLFDAYFVRVRITNQRPLLIPFKCQKDATTAAASLLRRFPWMRPMLTLRFPRTAKSCVGYLASLKRWDGNRFQDTLYTDFMRLAWSHNAATMGMDLLFDTPHWLDVCSTNPTTNAFYLQTNPSANRYGQGFTQNGVYRFTIQISAEEMIPIRFNLYFQWVGGWNHFEVWSDAEWPKRRATFSGTSWPKKRQG